MRHRTRWAARKFVFYHLGAWNISQWDFMGVQKGLQKGVQTGVQKGVQKDIFQKCPNMFAENVGKGSSESVKKRCLEGVQRGVHQFSVKGDRVQRCDAFNACKCTMHAVLFLHKSLKSPFQGPFQVGVGTPTGGLCAFFPGFWTLDGLQFLECIPCCSGNICRELIRGADQFGLLHLIASVCIQFKLGSRGSCNLTCCTSTGRAIMWVLFVDFTNCTHCTLSVHLCIGCYGVIGPPKGLGHSTIGLHGVSKKVSRKVSCPLLYWMFLCSTDGG